MTPLLGPGAPVLAFDIGGIDIKSALVDADGRLLGAALRARGVLAASAPVAAFAPAATAHCAGARMSLEDPAPHESE
ncbi:hypothetical protein E3O11_02470 [Cryobacterium levicorallinum]|uniref:ROK family protein n=1 Tax=Cryobacterium levicorallinum TaxID=995038 RepID=A0A1I3AUP8_9MICO|nr:hypothetical protein [Cryobacterium levicorallinum]TFB87964.1 hypothetical protein E3O11_02470 [Cryobacterium levicorallinum]GEP26850.1 hypothetical protein CLE01_14480 [Cryobacterium levicorallinum]SFH53734.1 hypothetical protein SAMN05216274_107140 [Cryobacterium levicorallinum]